MRVSTLNPKRMYLKEESTSSVRSYINYNVSGLINTGIHLNEIDIHHGSNKSIST
jgi:hypothetical protein